jgi:hypothetical protein
MDNQVFWLAPLLGLAVMCAWITLWLVGALVLGLDHWLGPQGG